MILPQALTMRLLNYLGALSALALVGSGCQTHKTVTVLHNGFEEVSHPYHTLLDDPPPPRIELRFRDTNGVVTTVWPSLAGSKEVVHGALAVFVAEKAFREPEAVTHPRLFAAQSPPNLPLDLTDEVLWRWSKANGKKFGRTLEKFAAITPSPKEDGIELAIEFWTNPAYGAEREDWPDDGVLQLSWDQVGEIMRAVKTKGVVEKDLRWHSQYVGEKY